MNAPTSRRGLLKGAAALGAGLVLGFRMTGEADAAAATGVYAPDAFIRIDKAGKATLIMPQVEMGQGVYTSIAMILAEELDVGLDQVVLEHAPPNEKLYMNPMLFMQATGNSNSIRAFWTPLRQAGADARARLVLAAAQTWKVEPASCTTDHGAVIHAASKRRLGYGALVDQAAALPPVTGTPLKKPADFKLIGKSAKRLDTAGKVDGSVKFGVDALPPGVKFATLAACPVFGGKVGSVDDSKAKSVPGVRQVIVLDNLVAVVGDHMWAAKQGLAACAITWDFGPNATLTSAQLLASAEAAANNPGVIAKTAGAGAAGLKGGEVVEAAYHVPFLAHAPMEPMNCTAHVRPDDVEIWVGTQVIAKAQADVAALVKLAPERVVIHNHLLGGGFGRRLETDGIVKAVRIAQKVDGPVKVVWTREEDIQQELYRPLYNDRFEARLEGGRIAAWRHRVIGPSIIARFAPAAFQNGLDPDAVDCAADIPYDIPDLEVSFIRHEPQGVPTAFWRGVGPAHNVFVIESFIDELARKAGQDPVAFRRGMLGKQPRLKAVMELAAEKSGWGQPLPAGQGRGIALQTAFGSYIATVAEVAVDASGDVKVKRLVCAVDTGLMVNPDTVEAQIQGGLVFGLSAGLFGQITIDQGRVQQSNFHDYRVVRMNQTPVIEVHLVKSAEAPGGIGETGTVAAPPAVGNAIYAATGKRIRSLPVDVAMKA